MSEVQPTTEDLSRPSSNYSIVERASELFTRPMASVCSVKFLALRNASTRHR